MAFHKVKSFFEMAQKIASQAVHGEVLWAPEEVREERREICEPCGFYNKTTTQCQQCGCFMALKRKLAVSYCNEGKWGPHDPKKPHMHMPFSSELLNSASPQSVEDLQIAYSGSLLPLPESVRLLPDTPRKTQTREGHRSQSSRT